MTVYIVEFEGSSYTWTLVTDDLVDGYAAMAQALHDWCDINAHADPEYFGLGPDNTVPTGADLVDWAGEYLTAYRFGAFNVTEMC